MPHSCTSAPGLLLLTIAIGCGPVHGALGGTASSLQAPQASVTAFVNVTVIPMDRERMLPRSTVLVQGGRITAVGPVAQVRVPTGAYRIDGQGQYLIPGLADMHAHITMFTDSATAERALLLLLANGVTTIREVDYGIDNALALRLRQRVVTGQLLGPRIYTSGDYDGQDSSLVQNIAAYKAKGYDFIKIRNEDSAPATEVATAAHQVGIPVMGHVPLDLSLTGALALGYASIEHLTGYFTALVRTPMSPSDVNAAMDEPVTVPDSVFLEHVRRALDSTRIPAVAAATQRAGVWNCPTLELQDLFASNVGVDTVLRWPELRYASEKRLKEWKTIWQGHSTTQRVVPGAGGTLDLLHQLVRALQASGAGLLSGTDANSSMIVPYLVPGFALHREFAALVTVGLTPYQALATSTRNVALYFGTLPETGTVEVGKRADLVLLAGNPLRDIRQTRRIVGVMHDGQWSSAATLEPQVTAALQALENRP